MEAIDIYTLSGMWRNSVRKFGDRIAVCAIEKPAMTYVQLDELRQQVSFWLYSQGVGHGDKVAIISENSPNWVGVFLAITSMGAISVPLLPDFSSTEINNILEHSDSMILFISKRIRQRHEDELKFNGKIVILDTLACEGSDKSILDFSVEKRSEFESYKPTLPDSQDVANIIYTSGTTGRSKGVMLTHDSLTFEIEKVLLVQDVNEKDVFLSLLPLSHVYENVLGMLLPLAQGASIYYISKTPTPTVLMQALSFVRPTIMLSVPLIMEKIYQGKIRPELTKNRILKGAMHVWPLNMFLNNIAGRKLKKAFGGRLRFLGVGGAPLNPQTERFLRDARFPYSCGYGLTETSSLIFGSHPKKTKFGTVGKPLDSLEYRLIRPEINNPTGEVVVKWRGNMKGYYKQPEATEAVLKNGNWFHTGDLGEVHDGMLTIKGRSKTMILGPSGENIYPEEIECVLNRMDGVIESFVYELKGKIVAKVYLNLPELGEKYDFFKSVAAYHSAEIHAKLSHYLNDMKDKLNSHLGKYSQVTKVELTTKPFEKTATQKIKRTNVNH